MPGYSEGAYSDLGRLASTLFLAGGYRKAALKKGSTAAGQARSLSRKANSRPILLRRLLRRTCTTCVRQFPEPLALIWTFAVVHGSCAKSPTFEDQRRHAQAAVQ